MDKGDRATVFLSQSPVSPGSSQIFVSVSSAVDSQNYGDRLVAVGKDGSVYQMESGGSCGGGKTSMTAYRLDGVDIKKIKYFSYQICPYTWAEFRDIAYSPKE
jgi:hypothetical protein